MNFRFGAIVLAAALLLTGCGPATPSVKAGESCNKESKAIVKFDGGAFECRLFAGNKRKYVQVSNTPVATKQTLNTVETSQCKLPDKISTPGKWTGGSVGYPAVGEFNSVGTVNVAVVPIDFSDVAEAKDAEWLQEQVDTMDDWITRFSNGKMKLNWQAQYKWVRAPKPAAMYNWAHPIIQADGSSKVYAENQQDEGAMRQQLFEAATKYYDFSKTDYVFFVFPKVIGNTIAHGPDARNYTVKTSKGTFTLGFSFTSGELYRMGYQWHQWIHEFLHSAGLKGHAPGNEMPYQIMGWDNQAGQGLDAWDTFILGWFDDNQVACYDLNKIKNESIILTSTERDLPGVKAAMVRLSNHELVVVESRRKDKYSLGYPDGFYGIQAYYIDTNNPGKRYDGATDLATEMKYFAYYLRVDAANHGYGEPKLDIFDTKLDVVGYVGDTFTYKNLHIKVTNTGDFDTIELTKN